MSRTYRRLNAWDKSYYVDARFTHDMSRKYIWSPEFCNQIVGSSKSPHYYHFLMGNKYTGLTVKTAIVKLSAKYHADRNRNYNHPKKSQKDFTSRNLRHRNNQELTSSIISGTEETLILSCKKNKQFDIWNWD